MMETFFTYVAGFWPYVAGFLAIVSALFGIYRGVATYRERKEKSSEAQFLLARKEAKESRENLRRKALSVSRRKYSHFTIDNAVPLLIRQSWLPHEPVPLENIDLQFNPDPRVKVTLSARRLPIYKGVKCKKYSDAIANIDKPKVFEDRSQYRLIKIDGKRLMFSEKKYSYFDKINYGEYLMHEWSLDNLKRRYIPQKSNRKRLLKLIRDPSISLLRSSSISGLTYLNY